MFSLRVFFYLPPINITSYSYSLFDFLLSLSLSLSQNLLLSFGLSGSHLAALSLTQSPPLNPAKLSLNEFLQRTEGGGVEESGGGVSGSGGSGCGSGNGSGSGSGSSGVDGCIEAASIIVKTESIMLIKSTTEKARENTNEKTEESDRQKKGENNMKTDGLLGGGVWVRETGHFWHLRDQCELPMVKVECPGQCEVSLGSAYLQKY